MCLRFCEGIFFGCKDLEFATEKAGLSLYRLAEKQTIKLRDDQICSNGKIIYSEAEGYTLYDIDSPKRKVVSYSLDVAGGALGEPQVVLDLSDLDGVPDGMVETPDGKSFIVAFYNPTETDIGEARQYSRSGELECIWTTPGAPRVTCPQFIELEGKVKLVLTTAVEDMNDELLAKCPNSGHLFIGDTNFESVAPGSKMP